MLFALVACTAMHAQQIFVQQAMVEYERRINMHKILPDDSWTQQMKSARPAHRVNYFNLYIGDSISRYEKGREPAEDKWKNMWGSEVGDKVIYKNHSNGLTTEDRQVYERRMLVQDSLINIEWRITDERREIAGFDCRKAVGRLYDSLYVVAFYTDEIPVSSGPEVYHGLPGLILGLAFPRYYTTWFATMVKLGSNAAKLAPPVAGRAKPVKRTELFETVKKTLNWGSEADKQRSFWQMVL